MYYVINKLLRIVLLGGGAIHVTGRRFTKNFKILNAFFLKKKKTNFTLIHSLHLLKIKKMKIRLAIQ